MTSNGGGRLYEPTLGAAKGTHSARERTYAPDPRDSRGACLSHVLPLGLRAQLVTGSSRAAPGARGPQCSQDVGREESSVFLCCSSQRLRGSSDGHSLSPAFPTLQPGGAFQCGPLLTHARVCHTSLSGESPVAPKMCRALLEPSRL